MQADYTVNYSGGKLSFWQDVAIEFAAILGDIEDFSAKLLRHVFLGLMGALEDVLESTQGGYCIRNYNPPEEVIREWLSDSDLIAIIQNRLPPVFIIQIPINRFF